MKYFFNKKQEQKVEGGKLNFELIHSIFHIPYSTFNPRAFTLIEAMVGIVIIVTAITGPLSVAVSSATYAKDTKDKITAIYLAQEAVDILRFERDSLLIKCSQNDDVVCPQYSLNGDPRLAINYGIDSFETTTNAAWRIFKSNLKNNTDCFVTDNGGEPGCSFDFYDFTQNTSLPPVKYVYTGSVDENCNYLFRDESAMGGTTGGAYLCQANGSGPSFKKTKFQRVIKLTHFNTVTGGNQYYQDYNDDVRVNVTVSYAKSYGIIKSVEVVDFLHAKI